MADNTSMFNNTTQSAVAPTNPHELALQSLCKQLLKSRLFRGYYVERRYVDNVKGYRDIVSLQKSEKDLEKMLRDIGEKLQMFYSHQNPQMWIGITSGPLTGITNQAGALETFIWAEIDDLAFDQYWFTIKSIRFRENEVIVKLKKVRSVEEEEIPKWSKPAGIQNNNKQISDKSSEALDSSTQQTAVAEDQITFDDFVLIIQQWWTSIKLTVYDFMSQDISKENIIGVLKFLGLLIVSIFSGALVAIKILGVFTLRFMFELSRLTHVLTPIIFKIIEVFNKMIGGFYILLAMIWKDTVVKRSQPKHAALEYNRPMYKSIEYNIQQRRSQPGSSTPTAPEFERRFQ